MDNIKILQITSPVLKNNGMIPVKYTCQGDDINSAISIAGIPEAAKSIVLIVDDPDAPMGTWNHWLVWDIFPTNKDIAEKSVPGT